MKTDIRANGRAPSENAICDWLSTAAPGDSAIYHRGFIARDRSPAIAGNQEHILRSVGRTADYVMALADAGLVHLVQRRLGAEDYDYIAVARPKARAVAA